MNLKCAIVDDEPLALNLLESYVNKTPFLELAGKYPNAVQAMNDLPEKRVDLLFLDIQMPELNGLEFSRMVDTHTRRPLPQRTGGRLHESGLMTES